MWSCVCRRACLLFPKSAVILKPKSTKTNKSPLWDDHQGTGKQSAESLRMYLIFVWSFSGCFLWLDRQSLPFCRQRESGASNIQASGKRKSRLRDLLHLQSNWHFPERTSSRVFLLQPQRCIFISFHSRFIYMNHKSHTLLEPDVLIHVGITSNLHLSAFFHQTASGTFCFTL